MNNEEKIKYLNDIKPYINLTGLCDLFNEINGYKRINYNNLRSVINGISKTRVSDEELGAFIAFIQNYFAKKILLLECNNTYKIKNSINNIISQRTNDIIKEIEEIFSNEFCNK